MIAVMVNGKSCIVLSIDLPPSVAQHRLVVAGANGIAAPHQGKGFP
jgi:hypothetical protein